MESEREMLILLESVLFVILIGLRGHVFVEHAHYALIIVIILIVNTIMIMKLLDRGDS